MSTSTTTLTVDFCCRSKASRPIGVRQELSIKNRFAFLKTHTVDSNRVQRGDWILASNLVLPHLKGTTTQTINDLTSSDTRRRDSCARPRRSFLTQEVSVLSYRSQAVSFGR